MQILMVAGSLSLQLDTQTVENTVTNHRVTGSMKDIYGQVKNRMEKVEVKNNIIDNSMTNNACLYLLA